MSTGGVFQLITNDGKQDRMLMATQMLRNRLESIRQKRRSDPSVQDETPTLLDIERTHVLFTNAHFKPFVALGYEYNKVNNSSGSIQLGGDVQFSIPQFGDFFNDMVLYVKLSAPSIATPGTADSADEDTARWCDYPGERLLKKVSFEVNGNPLDQYNSDATVFHRKFCVPQHKQLAWDRCVGQGTPKKAWVNADETGAAQGTRALLQVDDGPQVPKKLSELKGLELLVPLLFWCNKDPRLAVPSVAIPYGQRFINMTLASAAELCGVQNRGTGSSTLVAPTVDTMALYINNIFVNPEIHKIFIKRIGFTLIRVHRQQLVATSLPDQEVLLQNLKWPIECLFVGLRPADQKGSLRDWHKFVDVNEVSAPLGCIGKALTGTTKLIVDTTVSSATAPVVWTSASTNADKFAYGTRLVEKKTIDRVTVSAHGIYLYNDMPADFFNSYIPYTYGGPHIKAPEDEGALMIPFNLYPGTYQPSGHVNVSRAREFYFRFSSSVIGAGSPARGGELSILGSAINFLLISDGSAVLRYST